MVLVLAGAAGLTGCSNSGDDHQHPELRTGEQLYNHHCATCHQDSGEGTFLKGVPPVRYTAMGYREMVDYIRGHGRSEDSRMPQFATMPRAEAEKIAIYVRRKLKLRD